MKIRPPDTEDYEVQPRPNLFERSRNLDLLRTIDDLASRFFPRQGVTAVYNTGVNALTESERAVTKIYVCLLDRLPDPDGLHYWAGQLAAGASVETVSVQVFNGGYSRTIYGDLASNADFIAAAY